MKVQFLSLLHVWDMLQPGWACLGDGDVRDAFDIIQLCEYEVSCQNPSHTMHEML